MNGKISQQEEENRHKSCCSTCVCIYSFILATGLCLKIKCMNIDYEDSELHDYDFHLATFFIKDLYVTSEYQTYSKHCPSVEFVSWFSACYSSVSCVLCLCQ